MGGYQLSQGGAYNPAAARLDSRKSGSSDGSSSRRSSRTMESPNRGGFGYGGKRQGNLEGLVHPSPPRHSTACCDGLSLRRELNSQRIKCAAADAESRGHSFRSDDSDSLALWEEMDSMSSSSSVVAGSVAPSERDGWVKLSTQSPRWLDAMAKLAPWRSSPVHPRSGDMPRASLDRKSSTRSLHESSRAWYSKRCRSMWSPKLATNSSKWDQSSKGDRSSEDGSKHGSFSRMMDEDTRFTASAVAWDISSACREPASENSTRPVSGLAWEIPVDAKITDDTLPDSAPESSASEEAQFDGHSEYASCRTFVEDELPSPEATDEAKSSNEVGYVNVIDFVAPLLTKLQSIEKEAPRAERRVSFKWEAGPKIRGEEVVPTTETPKPPGGDSAAYETLRQQYILKSQSAPLDGLYMFMPESYSALPWEKKPAGDGALRRVNSSPDHRLFRTAPGPSPLGIGIGIGIDSSKSDQPESPRSILRGPDDGSSSVPSSSNPSRRSEGPQSMSSCSESFDDYELITSSTAYNLNSACIIVESRRVSLSFRDFGPAQPADMAEARESSNVELLGCDRAQLSANALRASPELWTATISARYHDVASASPPGTAASSPQPLRQLAYLMSCEDELEHQELQELHEQQQQQRPMAEMQRTRSRNGEFTARLGVMFSPLRLISSHESSSNHGCFVATTLSPPHDDGEKPQTIVNILPPALDLHSTPRKSKGSWTGTQSRSSKRRYSPDDPQTMMVSFSKAMKKILSKCTVKRSTSKGKSKTDSPALKALPPPEFHFT